MSNDIIFPNDAVHNVNVNVKNFVPGKPGKSPYIGDNGHWFYYDEQTDQWLDSGTPAQGDAGADGTDGENAVFYTLEPSTPYILYDPAAGSGEKNSPDHVTLYAYKYEAGVKTPYTATEIEADILYEDENGEIPTYHMEVGRTTNNIVVDVNEEDGWATIEASFTTYDNQTISCKVLPVRNGHAGKGITTVTKTGTSGLVDTYTILYDDGTTTTFFVTNGTPYIYADGNTLVITSTLIDADEEEY